MSWANLTHFAGLDWAADHHDVAIVDAHGAVIEEFAFDHTAEGWSTFADKIAPYPSLPVAIETSQGLIVERLLAAGCTVYPVQPVAAKSYRERKKPSGVKTNQIDAWALADALRVDGHQWRSVHGDSEIVQELRLLCRGEVALIEQRTALVNQLIDTLKDYYPAALEAFDDWTAACAWAFIKRFSTPQALAKARKRCWERWLRNHGLYSDKLNAKRLEIFAQATQLCGSEPRTSAKSLLAVSLVDVLTTLEKQLKTFRKRIEDLFAQHPDADIFSSLPGPGAKVASRLLAEIGDDRSRFSSAEALQCYGGTAPANHQTGRRGKNPNARMRRACNKDLRAAMHWFADLSIQKSPWARIYYKQKRAEGKTHVCALRCLGNRWMKILWTMWQTRTVYDPELHQRNQIEHGSWVLTLMRSSS